MNFTIRSAKKEDMSRVLNLIKELASFEKEEHAVEVTIEELQRDGFESKPAFKCFVADEVSKVVEWM